MSDAKHSAGSAASPEEATSRLTLVGRRFVRNRSAMFGSAVVLLLFVSAYLVPFVSPWEYTQLDFNAFLEPPGGTHWFGTTQNGFDVFALTMRGMQKSLVIGLLGAVIATVLAATIGAFAGYFGGAVNTALVTLIDLLMVLPSFLIIAILSPSFRGRTWLIFVLLLAAFQWMVTARIVRGMTLSLRDREFVRAAKYMGAPAHRVIATHIVPNIASILIIDTTLNVGAAILAETGLSYLGFGVQQPDVSLGSLIAMGTASALTYPWLFMFAGGLLVITVLSANLIGDGLRDAFDPSATGARKARK